MNNLIVEICGFLVILVLLSIPLGNYIYMVMTGQTVLLSKVFSPMEDRIYDLMGITDGDSMTPRKYASSIVIFSGIGLFFVFGIQLLQNILPLNPEGFNAPSWDLAFNTASSFVSNTNWQAYAGESTMKNRTR